MYESTIQLFVSTPSSAVDISALAQGSSFSQQRVKSYAQVINGSATLEPVIQKLKLPYSVQELASNVKATAPLDTVLINVSVMDADPITAANIANAIGYQFTSTASNLEFGDQATGIKVSVVKAAIASSSPASPKKLLNLLLGIILGFGLGLALALVRIIFDNTIKNEEQLENIPLLAAITFDKEAKKKPLITDIDRYAVRSEAFRTLRTNLQFINPDSPNKVIALTSASPSEGKTSTAINLAIALSLAGHKTLYIEADMRRPKLSKYTNLIEHKSGFANLLELQNNEISESQILQSTRALGDSGLQVITAGDLPANPSELLNSQNLETILDLSRNMFDYVIIDTPPILAVTDAAIIATKSDGVLVVIYAGNTVTSQLKGVLTAISQVGANCIGVVLNMIPTRARDYDNYGYRYGYSYGYKYRSKSNYGAYYAPETKDLKKQKAPAPIPSVQEKAPTPAPVVIAEPEPIFEPVPEPEPIFEPVPEPEPIFEPVPEPVFDPVPEPEVVPEPEPVAPVVHRHMIDSSDKPKQNVFAPNAPTFDNPFSVANGFLVNLTNYNPTYEYQIRTTAGRVKIGQAGEKSLPLTISGLTPGQSAKVEATIVKASNPALVSEVTGSALFEAFKPSMGKVVPTLNGFRLTITNYDPAFTFTATANKGTVNMRTPFENSLPFSISDLNPGETAIVSIKIERPGYIQANIKITGTCQR